MAIGVDPSADAADVVPDLDSVFGAASPTDIFAAIDYMGKGIFIESLGISESEVVSSLPGNLEKPEKLRGIRPFVVEKCDHEASRETSYFCDETADTDDGADFTDTESSFEEEEDHPHKQSDMSWMWEDGAFGEGHEDMEEDLGGQSDDDEEEKPEPIIEPRERSIRRRRSGCHPRDSPTNNMAPEGIAVPSVVSKEYNTARRADDTQQFEGCGGGKLTSRTDTSARCTSAYDGHLTFVQRLLRDVHQLSTKVLARADDDELSALDKGLRSACQRVRATRGRRMHAR